MNYIMNNFMLEDLIRLKQEKVARETRYNYLYYNDIKYLNKPALACNLLCVLGKFLIHTGEKLHEMAGESARVQQSSSQTLMSKAG